MSNHCILEKISFVCLLLIEIEYTFCFPRLYPLYIMLAEKYFWILLTVMIITAYFFGLTIPLMDVDAAQYASISLELYQKGEWLHVFNRGLDYLDKPPLTFWLAKLSFMIFGVSTWAFKLPSVLASIGACVATYRFSRLYFDVSISRLAAFMLASTQAFFLINNDPRTDTQLLFGVMLALWQGHAWLKSGSIWHAVGLSLGISWALHAKGPIGLFVPVFCTFPTLMLRRQWKLIFHVHYLLVAVLVLVSLIPMSIGLYQQFGIKGLRFYFWTQSFGRITGENTWRNDVDIFYLFHSSLWSLLPWSLIWLLSIRIEISKIANGWKTWIGQPSSFLFIGFVLSYLALGMSKYQLPHYAYVFYGPVAILMALAWLQSKPNLPLLRWIVPAHWILLLGLYALCSVLVWYSFPPDNAWGYGVHLALSMLMVALLIWVQYQPLLMQSVKLAMQSIVVIAICNLLLNIHVYPSILKYQPTSLIAAEVSRLGYIHDFSTYDTGYMQSLDFYCKRIVHNYEWEDFSKIKENVVLTTGRGCDSLMFRFPESTILSKYTFKKSVTILPIWFYNPEKRSKELPIYYLVLVKRDDLSEKIR